MTRLALHPVRAPRPWPLVVVLLLGAATPPTVAEDEFERPPIAYSATTPVNPVERLQEALDAGATRLGFDPDTGYLPGILAALDVPVSSQTLVFSKTSLQQSRIRPTNPRAIYFNDDVYVGYVRTGDVLEISVADPVLGAVFYTLEQVAAERPRFIRQTDDCLLCHGGSQTRGIPGHVVRSVYPDADGQPIFAAGSHRVDHTTPFEKRFGGWIVTGDHGSRHLGNAVYTRRGGPGELPTPDPLPRFAAAGYLSADSDLVALLVLAHQTHAHNVLTKASFDVRAALHREAALNAELGEPADHRWGSTETILDAAAAAVVDCLLFRDEAPLPTPLAGSSEYAVAFAARGPCDPLGRSLRTFDLRTRLFRHPCSFLIYSPSFDALPEDLRQRFWSRLAAVLEAAPGNDGLDHLSADDRATLRSILAATKPGTPPGWSE